MSAVVELGRTEKAIRDQILQAFNVMGARAGQTSKRLLVWRSAPFLRPNPARFAFSFEPCGKVLERVIHLSRRWLLMDLASYIGLPY
jgi:hypothetical protein